MADIVEFNNAKRSSGSTLKAKYLATQDKEKIDKYTKEATKLLDEFEKDLDNLIEKGKAPVATRNPSQSTGGILVNNSELESMLKDFLFNVILGEEADRRDLKIDFQATPIGMDAKTHQPVLGIVIACTFK